MKRFNESFLSGTASVYIEQLYEEWRENPKNVLPEWDAYFQNVNEGLKAEDVFDDVNADIADLSLASANVSEMDK
jgi:2-oxoglutarate dehydrogenase complex dehydrogenase (E1) component-like enzyme